MSSDNQNSFPSGPTPGYRHDTFLDDPVQDHLLRAVMTLAMELSVAREQIKALQTTLIEKDVVSTEEIDFFKPSSELEKSMAANRAKLVDDLLGPLISSLKKS